MLSYARFIWRFLPGSPISVMFLAPAVTPWKTTLPGVHNGANNPGIRVFVYDRETLLLKVGDGFWTFRFVSCK